MSSRSNGVTNVRLRSEITSCVSRSPSCSSSLISRIKPWPSSGNRCSSSASSREISTVFADAWENSAKNSRFCGFSLSASGAPFLVTGCSPDCYTAGRRHDACNSGQEVDAGRGARGEAVDGERGQRLRLEEPHQETDGEIGGDGRAARGNDCLPADAVAVRAEELG